MRLKPITNSRDFFLILFSVAILLRMLVAFYLGNVANAPSLLTDQGSYHHLAIRLADGHGYSFEQAWYPFTPANTPTAHWSFGYTAWIAGIYTIFGTHPLAVRIIQAIIAGILLPFTAYYFTNQAIPTHPHRHTIAQFTALIAACYPYFILYAVTLMTESFYLITLLWSLERSLALLNWIQQPTANSESAWKICLWLGISLGISTLLRQAVLPWVPVLFLYLLWQSWQSGRLSATFTKLTFSGLILLAFILPWTWRNYRVYGDFLLLNSNTGYAMYSAQHPMHGTSFQEYNAAPMPAFLTGNEAQLDRQLLTLGIGFIKDDPLRYLQLSLSRVRDYFEFLPSPDTTLVHNIGRTVSFGLALPFMIFGLFLARQQPGNRPQNLRLLYLFMGFYTFLHLLTWAMVRYRLPVDSVLIFFAGISLSHLWHTYINKHPKSPI
jgi:hypothetical protein